MPTPSVDSEHRADREPQPCPAHHEQREQSQIHRVVTLERTSIQYTRERIPMPTHRAATSPASTTLTWPWGPAPRGPRRRWSGRTLVPLSHSPQIDSECDQEDASVASQSGASMRQNPRGPTGAANTGGPPPAHAPIGARRRAVTPVATPSSTTIAAVTREAPAANGPLGRPASGVRSRRLVRIARSR